MPTTVKFTYGTTVGINPGGFYDTLIVDFAAIVDVSNNVVITSIPSFLPEPVSFIDNEDGTITRQT